MPNGQKLVSNHSTQLGTLSLSSLHYGDGGQLFIRVFKLHAKNNHFHTLSISVTLAITCGHNKPTKMAARE